MFKHLLLALLTVPNFGFTSDVIQKQSNIQKTIFKMPRRKYLRNETCHGRVANFYAVQQAKPIKKNVLIEIQKNKLKEAEEKLIQLQCADQLASINENAMNELSIKIEEIKKKFLTFKPNSLNTVVSHNEK